MLKITLLLWKDFGQNFMFAEGFMKYSMSYFQKFFKYLAVIFNAPFIQFLDTFQSKFHTLLPKKKSRHLSDNLQTPNKDPSGTLHSVYDTFHEQGDMCVPLKFDAKIF